MSRVGVEVFMSCEAFSGWGFGHNWAWDGVEILLIPSYQRKGYPDCRQIDVEKAKSPQTKIRTYLNDHSISQEPS